MKLHPWFRKQFRKKPRIYIMPTRMGGYLNGLVFLMFLLAVGYNNNLLLIFTLFLFGFNLIWVIQTHFHLHALKLHSISISDGHVAENVRVHARWSKAPLGPFQWELTLETEDQELLVKSIQHESSGTEGSIVFSKRGVWNFTYLKVKTEMPFGLYQVWVFYRLETRGYAYPKRFKDVPPVSHSPSALTGEHSTLIRGPHDVWNLAPYQGEESRKISWKHYARSGELVIKEGEELSKTLVHFILRENPPNKELLLSVMASQMVLCAKTETPFSLETPVKKMSPGLSSSHLTECLRELAAC
jgi:uncharacterized protein (DUF58 family)